MTANLLRGLAMAAFILTSVAVPALAQTPASRSGHGAPFAPRDETPEEFPSGAGRDETFYACTACHNFKLVAAQGMTRRQWEDSLDWMTERHNMPKLDEKDREVVLNYLEKTFPPRAPAARGGWQNPFLSR